MSSRFTYTLVVSTACAAATLPLACLAQAGSPAGYKSAAEVSVEQFFALPDYRDMVISPDGKKIAAVAPLRGRGNLVIIDLATRKASGITASDRWDASSPVWIGNNRLYFTVGDGFEATGRARVKGAYSINVDGSDMREMFGYNANGAAVGKRVVSVLRAEGGNSTSAIVTMRERSREWSDVYRLDFRTLRSELLSFDSPGRTVRWVIDTKDKVRMAVREEERPQKGQPQKQTYWHRPADGGKWELLFETSSHGDPEDIDLCGIDNDDQTLLVSARRGRDKAAVWKYDLASKTFGAMLVEDAVVDVNCSSGAVIRERDTRKIVGFRYQSGLPKQVYFDSNSYVTRAAQQISAAVSGYPSVGWSEDGSSAIVIAYADIEPGEFYVYNRAKQQLEQIARARPWVKPELMAERKFIQYRARDGMMIPAYLTLPRNAKASGLPLIVNVHGGPRVRGYQWSAWGRWPEAQFFASRGYAVLEPEPRGSLGFGWKHDTAGYKQWGLSMQDDITDGALSLVKDGIVDKDRICLHGGSYGGYATLQGLVKEPDLFKCGSAFVAVSDLALLQSVAYSDTAMDSDYFENEFKVWVGDSQADAALFAQNSPARQADKIKAPLMLTMGSDDVRVPLIHGEVMRDAMRKAGKPLEWKVYAEEGHGFNRPANVADFYTRSLRLFDSTIGSGRQK
jgi:dipeptidyl aminopeptidase/acylaminoacyl peptidase